MKLKNLLYTLLLIAVTITVSCKKDLYFDSPTQIKNNESEELITSFKEKFVQRKYNELLKEKLSDSLIVSWDINWTNYSKSQFSDSTSSYYFEINPRVTNSINQKDFPAQEVNLKKYLIVIKNNEKVFFRIATYFFSSKSDNKKETLTKDKSASINSIGENYSFNKFTGYAIYRNLDVKTNNISFYENGVKINNNLSTSSKKINSVIMPNYDVLECNVIWTCQYSARCDNSYYITVTTSKDGCQEPLYTPSGCTFFGNWILGNTSVNSVCKTVSYPDLPDQLPIGIIAPPPPSSGNPTKKPCPGDPVTNARIAASSAHNVNGGRFGFTRNGGTKFHDGTDIFAVPNTPVYPVMDGKVVLIEKSHEPSFYKEGSYGNYVTVESTLANGDKLRIRYAHFSSVSQDLQLNMTITSGTLLGLSGRTGNQNTKHYYGEFHVHLQATLNGAKINPEPYIRTKFTATAQPIITPC